MLQSQIFQVCNELLMKKENADYFKEIGLKIRNLSSVKRDFVTEFFIILAKLDFREQFMLWFKA